MISFQIRRTHTQYDTFRGNHPDYSQIRSLNPFLDGRSGGGGSGPVSCRYPQSLQEHVRFARARFGHYDLIDFAVALIGYALSGEPTLKAFYERLLPFAEVFMALFGRHRLPSCSALSRFLAALDQTTVEALRTLFQKDLVARKPFDSPGGLWDRFGQHWVVMDVDGTRAVARQRALPQLVGQPTMV